jgi:NAD(P)-dependent dehydrogenase (short-subunit alcohol dehydrogenase family)
MKKLENKTVFITGGLSGIGKACAIASAKEGANVILADFRSDIVDKTIEEIKKESVKAMFIDCDVSRFKQVETAVQKVIDTFGTLDIALNNAGIGGTASEVEKMTEEVWLQVININLNGVFNCMRHELAVMWKQQKGVIVNMSSVIG